MTALLIAALLLVLACATYYDATGFPRHGTEAEQRAFHRKLYALQAALFGGYAIVTWLVTGDLVNSFAVALACIVGTAAHDLVGYWGWRFALGLSRYERGQFFGSQPYTKRTNLLFLVLTLGGDRPEVARHRHPPRRPRRGRRAPILWRFG